MFGMEALFLIFALLCTGHCEESSENSDELRNEYLDKCNAAFPKTSEMDVYYDDDGSFCKFYCFGLDDEDDFFVEDLPKDNAVACKLYNSDAQAVCMNGSCVQQSDVELCNAKKSEIGELKSMEVNECDIDCVGDTKTSVQKPEGDSCYLEDSPWMDSKCTSYGQCLQDRNYVDDPTGENVATADTAKAMCREQFPQEVEPESESIDDSGSDSSNDSSKDESDSDSNDSDDDDDEDNYMFPIRDGDFCDIFCYLGEKSFGSRSFKNGISCGEDWTCMGGGCRDSKDIDACKQLLENDTLLEMNYNECNVNCMGQSKMEHFTLAVNATCTKKLEGWYEVEGICGDDGLCQVDEESYDYDYNTDGEGRKKKK